MSKLQIKVGDVLTIDGKPAKATVIEVGSVGCYILTEDNCKIPFFWTELEHRNVQIVGRSITQGDIVKFVQVFEEGDEIERLEVLEDRGDRVLVQSLTNCADWAVRPTHVYFKSDLYREAAQ